MRYTAGFGYTFFNPEVKKKPGFPRGLDEFSGRIEDIDHSLLFEPGTKFNYGVRVFNLLILFFHTYATI